MEILKFGGKSLGSQTGLSNIVNIVRRHVQDSQVCIVVSARGETTNLLLALTEQAKNGKNFESLWQEFVTAQKVKDLEVNLDAELKELHEILHCVYKLQDISEKIENQILAYGECLSARILQALLAKNNLFLEVIDSRDLIHTQKIDRSNVPVTAVSEELTQNYFKNHIGAKNSIVTGFIARDITTGGTTTLGRNGSNYSATLLAKYLNAERVINYSHVDGVFTTDPNLVADALLIPNLSYDEANELANFGMNVLHAKTILPLIEKEIPLELKNTLNPDAPGTVISKFSNGGIKALSVLQHQAIITLEGRGMLGTVGIDGRIFGRLKDARINVGIISQGSSERNISFLVHSEDAENAKNILLDEFELDIAAKNVNSVAILREVAVISVVGQDLSDFGKAYQQLIKNNAMPLLLNSTLNGNNLGLVVKNELLSKTLSIIHNEIFKNPKKLVHF